MEIIPAIDIRDGKCVQLYQGDYAQETVYSDDPIKMASHWVRLGALRLHLVDLDGARTGRPINTDIIGAIAASAGVPIQYGGGIRSVENALQIMKLGIDRVIIGTAAINTPNLIDQACQEFGPEAVVVGLDARNGYVATDGWTKSSQVPILELVNRIAESHVRRFMYTDILRDGTLTAPNYPAIHQLLNKTDLGILVAGGISSIDHINQLAHTTIEGAIIGTALYSEAIDLQEAIHASQTGNHSS